MPSTLGKERVKAKEKGKTKEERAKEKEKAAAVGAVPGEVMDLGVGIHPRTEAAPGGAAKAPRGKATVGKGPGAAEVARARRDRGGRTRKSVPKHVFAIISGTVRSALGEGTVSSRTMSKSLTRTEI